MRRRRSPDAQVGAEQKQGDADYTIERDGRLLETEPIDDHRGGELSRDGGSDHASGADRGHADQRHYHVEGAKNAAAQVIQPAGSAPRARADRGPTRESPGTR